jgi:hypothetical protein
MHPPRLFSASALSDNLVDLNSVVPIVARSKHLVVVFTRELIFRPWCLCEIHTALSRAMPITMLDVHAANGGGVSLPTESEFSDYVDYLFNQNRFRKIFDDNHVTQQSLLHMFQHIAASPMVTVDCSSASQSWEDSVGELMKSLSNGDAAFRKSLVAKKSSSRAKGGPSCRRVVAVFTPQTAVMARVIQTMLHKAKPNVNVVIEHEATEVVAIDGQAGADTLPSSYSAAAEPIYAARAAVRESYGVLVLLTKGLLECAPAMVQLVTAVESGKRIMPIIIDPGRY